MWAVLNLFFLFGALPINLVYAGIFFFVELAFALVAASYFATADGKLEIATALKKSGGGLCICGGAAGLLYRSALDVPDDFFLELSDGRYKSVFCAERRCPKEGTINSRVD